MINNILENYKKITKEIIVNFKNGIYINELMDKRGELLKELFERENIDKNNVKKLYLEKGLLDIDNELKIIIEKEQIKVKEEIRSLHKLKSANNVYGKNINTISIFNKKI